MFPATPNVGLDRLRSGRLERAGRLAADAASPLRTLARRVGGAARAAAFWLAVATPLAYLGLPLAGTLTAADLTALAALVAGNVAALVVGHGYAAGTAGSVQGRADGD